MYIGKLFYDIVMKMNSGGFLSVHPDSGKPVVVATGGSGHLPGHHHGHVMHRSAAHEKSKHACAHTPISESVVKVRGTYY